MRVGFAFALSICLIFLVGCAGYTAETGAGDQNKTTDGNQPPFVDLKLNSTEGPSPFRPAYTYWCSDPDNNLAYCELRIDGRAYANGKDQKALLPTGYVKPDFYFEITSEVGKHTLEMFAVDDKGLNSSKIVEFEVLPGLPITKLGWYRCNDYPDREPCTTFLSGYCGKFNSQDLSVRMAASSAISKHPGAFSINQILDIYDYVHGNVFYQNVPLDMFPPYYPNETLKTKSGDCKNQAVLIASMVEAIGGSARILLVPGCQHAFAEVYVGTDENLTALKKAIWWHYETENKSIAWHISENAENKTKIWLILDTAGGSFPGNTIPECVKKNITTYEIRNCGREYDELQAPEISGTELGPFVMINDTRAIQPEWGRYYWQEPTEIGTSVEWCRFKLKISSRSPTPLNWYYTNTQGYQNWDADRSFSYFYGEEQVKESTYVFDRDTPDKFYIIVKNTNKDSSLTMNIELIQTCYNN